MGAARALKWCDTRVTFAIPLLSGMHEMMCWRISLGMSFSSIMIGWLPSFLTKWMSVLKI